mgnify:CR=1 FL=1
MKKFYILLTALVFINMGVKADTTYQYLTFLTSTSSVSMSIDDLQLTISGSQLVAVNAQETRQFQLTDLQKMYFSGEIVVTSIQQLPVGSEGAVVVYAIDGQQLGQYDTMTDAIRQLHQGQYVIVQNGQTQKILVK